MNRSIHEHDLPDAELVRRAQRGSPTAFGLLVSRYQDRIYNTCYRMCHHEADARDLTQATFLRALEALPRFEQRATFYTWLFRIAVNLTMSQRRSAGRRNTGSLDARTDSGGELASPANSGPGRGLERQELAEHVAAALAQLDEEFRAAVVLKDIEDLDYASIAEILDVPVGTVKSRIHRGRLLLRDLLRSARSDVERA